MFLCSVNSPQRLRCVFSVVLFFALVLSVSGVSAQESHSTGQAAASRLNTPAAGPLVNPSVPSYVVTTAADDASGIPGNCTNQSAPGATPDASCSLRDALAASGTGGGNITFSATVFGVTQPVSARTITLGVGGILDIPSNTAIAGLTTGNGPTTVNLVTVDGNKTYRIFNVNPGVTNTAISQLTITNALADSVANGMNGGGIYNQGALTVSSCTLMSNVAGDGGGIFNDSAGTLTLTNSTVSGNSQSGIANQGSMTIVGSTVAGNIGGTNSQGSEIENEAGSLTITGSTISSNGLASYSVIYNSATLTMRNDIVAGDPGVGDVPCDGPGSGCPSNGADGNIVTANAMLAFLTTYGGPMQTMPALPGSPAICSGLIADIPSGITTDQRGLPRKTTYGSAVCLDSGAVQTNYSLSFITQPPASVAAGAFFTAGIQLSESGSPFPASGVVIPIALGAGDAGQLNFSSLLTNFNGEASSSGLQVGAPGTDDTLVTNLPLTAQGVTPQITLSSTSSSFDVTSSTTQVTVEAAPSGPTFTVDGTSYTAPVTLTWSVGSQHTIATTSPQSSACDQYNFGFWTDGGAISHPVTASTSTPVYQAEFNVVPVSSPSCSSSNGNFVVNTATDDAAGVAANCTTPGGICTLRDALLAASVAGSGNITFDPTVFGASQSTSARTITVTHGTLNVASNTTVTGPTTGSGSSLTNLVTVYGDTAGNSIFNVSSGVVNAALSNLNVTAPSPNFDSGSGFYNDGALTLTNISINGVTSGYYGGGVLNDSAGTLILSQCSILNSVASQGGGGGIENVGVLTILKSTISGNRSDGDPNFNYGAGDGGGIENGGFMTITDSTISGNSVREYGIGGGIQNDGVLTLTNSTVTGNRVDYMGNGAGIYTDGLLTVTNSIVADNTIKNSPEEFGPPVEDDCVGPSCPTNEESGNVVGAGLSSFLPGSPAICAGLLTDLPSGLATDQRGAPRTTTYGTTTCVDAGAIQTHYSLSFSQEPPATVGVGTTFTAAIQLSENGSPVQSGGFAIPIALGQGDNGSLSNGTATTNASGTAIFSNLMVSATGTGDTLIATFPVTTTPPPPSLTSPLSISATSSAFDVTSSTTDVHVTFGTSQAGLTVTVDGTDYVAPVNLVWSAGSQHLIATTSPQTLSGEMYVFSSWSDGGAISHTVTAGNSASYTATFLAGSQAIVNTVSDDATGAAANCASGNQFTCTLRDALAAATSNGGGNITFDPTVFAATQPVSARTIMLTGGTLSVPSNTTITGPTTGPTLTPLVTVDGNNQFTVFTVGSEVTSVANPVVNAVLYGLIITGGNDVVVGGILTEYSESTVISNCLISGNSGGGIMNVHATLTLMNSTVSRNSSMDSGGIFNNVGTVTIVGSTISGNSVLGQYFPGGGIDNQDVLVVSNSTISGNSSQVGGSGIDGGTMTMTNSTVTGNSTSNGSGAGINSAGPMTVVNSIVSGNTANGSEADCTGSGCPSNGTNGNIVTANAMLAPLGNYGGPTQTMPSLPGSPALCAGVIASIPVGLTTDQRSLPRKTTYGDTSCVDSGAVETNYALSFSTQPPASVLPNAGFAAAVQLDESGTAFSASGIPIPLALGAGDIGTLSGNSASTGTNGVASYSQLMVSAAGTGDTLVATLPLTVSPPPSSLTSPISISASSNAFDVNETIQTQAITFPALASPVTYGVAPMTLKATASSGLPVTYALTGPATINGSTLIITGAGTVAVTASQSGNTDYSAAAPVSQTIVVNKATSATTISSSSPSANLNTSVTFTATIMATAGTPTGSVQFLDGMNMLGSSPLNAEGVATYSTSSLTAGSHTINAVYGGDANFAGSQSMLTQSITTPGFSLSANPTTLTIQQGQTGQAKITLTSTGGDSGTFTFACGGLPEFAACIFNPTTLMVDGSNASVSTMITIITQRNGYGMVTRLSPKAPASGGNTALMCWLPAGLLGFVLCWQRKRLTSAAKGVLLVLILIAGVSGLTACGGSPGTPVGSSTITITATSGSISQSTTVSVTVTK